jgi:hypothetical protein
MTGAFFFKPLVPGEVSSFTDKCDMSNLMVFRGKSVHDFGPDGSCRSYHDYFHMTLLLIPSSFGSGAPLDMP